jgi:pimeloyl-ACP methyl ester carboxylesterase
MRIAGRFLKWLGIVFATLCVAGAIYQQVGAALDARYAPPDSQMVAVDDHMVHVACMGRGPRSFVLDAGLSGWSFEWFRLQPLLAKLGRACAFDRPGMGWSESAGIAHDGGAAADKLAKIVAAAGIHTPFYYVGHSLGANYAQIYYAKHPHDVAGLILFEPGDPKDLLEDFKGSRADAMATGDCGGMCFGAGAASTFGIPRLAMFFLKPGMKSWPARINGEYQAGLSREPAVVTAVGDYLAVPKTAYEDLDVKSFGDTPVLVFDSSRPRPPEGKETVADVKVWKKGQLAFLAALSAKSKHGIGPVHVPDSSHASMVMGESQAAFDADAIARFIGVIEVPVEASPHR